MAYFRASAKARLSDVTHTAPISTNLILAYLGRHVLGMQGRGEPRAGPRPALTPRWRGAGREISCASGTAAASSPNLG
jgi:hypothetical protein